MQTAISQMIQADPTRVFTLDELRHVNLADKWVDINNEVIRVRNSYGDLFVIKRPHLVDCHVTLEELEVLEKQLRARAIAYSVQHHPPYYYKDQANVWLATIELETTYLRHGPRISLLQEGGSYGKLLVECTIEVDISHSLLSCDYTDGFHLVGCNRMPAMTAIIASMSN